MGEGFVLKLMVFLWLGHLMRFLKKLMQEAECDIPDVVVGRAHRICKGYVEKN